MLEIMQIMIIFLGSVNLKFLGKLPSADGNTA